MSFTNVDEDATSSFLSDHWPRRIRLDSANVVTLLTIIGIGPILILTSLRVFPPAVSVTLLALSGLAPIAADYLSRGDVFAPSGFFGLGYLITILGPALDFATFGPDDRALLLGHDLGYLVIPMVFVNLYVMALMTGYTLAPNRLKRDTRNQTWNNHRARMAGIVLLIVGILGCAVYVRTTGGIPTSLTEISQKRRPPTEYIRLVAYFVQFGAIILFADYLRSSLHRRLSARLLFAGSFLLGVLLPFYGSQRTRLMTFIIILAVIGYYQSDKITGPRIFSLFPVGILLSNTMLMLRQASWKGISVSDFSQLLNPLSLLGFFEANRGGLAAHAHLVHLVPTEISYRSGSTLLAWMVFPIPRSIWSGKPVNLGQELGVIIYDVGEGIVGAGAPPFLAGDLYLNFDVFGIIFGGLLLGIIVGIVASYLRLGNEESIAMSILYAVFVTMFGMPLLMGNLTLTMTRFLQYFVVFILTVNYVID